MSRFNSWLNELQPEMFVELSPELAAERGIVHGGWLTVQSARGRHRGSRDGDAAAAPALESTAAWSIRSASRSTGPSPARSSGDNANDLTSLVADPNVSMHEAKAFACQVVSPAAGGAAPRPTKSPAPWPTREPVPDTPAAAQPEGEFGMTTREQELAALPPGRRSAPSAGSALAGAPHRAVPPRRGAGAAAGHRVLHRHDRLHRLQGVRGRVQAVEPASRGRVRLDRQQLRQHRRAVGHVLAAREVHRAVRRRATARRRARTSTRHAASRPLADDERRLQALRRGAVPAGLPDRRDHLQRVRQRLHPAGHLQRLRVLRRGLSVRRDHPQHASTATPTSARCATTARRDGLVPACAKACPTESIQFGPIDELRERARNRVEELHRRGRPGRLPVRRRRGTRPTPS